MGKKEHPEIRKSFWKTRFQSFTRIESAFEFGHKGAHGGLGVAV